jgi:hypothetical protein
MRRFENLWGYLYIVCRELAREMRGLVGRKNKNGD